MSQIVPPGAVLVPGAVERFEALLRAWAVGFASCREDVISSELRVPNRGFHEDECATFLRALDASLVEANCRVTGLDSLGQLLGRWLDIAAGASPEASKNSDRKYVQLLELTSERPVFVLLVAAGARWWFQAFRERDVVVLTESEPRYPTSGAG